MIDLDPLGTPYGPYIASVIEGEYNGLIYDNGQIWLDKNPADMLRNRLRYQEEAARRGTPPTPKTGNKDRRAKHLQGEACHFEANLFDKDQTTFETCWSGGSVFAGRTREAGTQARANVEAHARSRSRAERRDRAKAYRK